MQPLGRKCSHCRPNVFVDRKRRLRFCHLQCGVTRGEKENGERGKNSTTFYIAKRLPLNGCRLVCRPLAVSNVLSTRQSLLENGATVKKPLIPSFHFFPFPFFPCLRGPFWFIRHSFLTLWCKMMETDQSPPRGWLDGIEIIEWFRSRPLQQPLGRVGTACQNFSRFLY